MDYRFTLQKGYRTKTLCPQCGRKTFHRYIDTQTGETLPPEFGRCDREINCGYFLKPDKSQLQNRDNNNISVLKYRINAIYKAPTQTPVYLPKHWLDKVCDPGLYPKNRFLQYLIARAPYPFPEAEVYQVARLYQVGTIRSGYWEGATAFPFIDRVGNVRGVQVKKFTPENHTKATTWMHAIALQAYRDAGKPAPEWLKQYDQSEGKAACLFGEPLLLKYPDAVVCLVEAPKTAIYATLYFGLPEASGLVWLAVGSLSYFTPDRLKVLQGRKVMAFPDASTEGKAFKQWSDKAKAIFEGLPASLYLVSDVLESLPETEKAKGLDIADVLITLNPAGFRVQNCPKNPDNTEAKPAEVSEYPDKPTPVKTQKNGQISGVETLDNETLDKLEGRKPLYYFNGFPVYIRGISLQ